MLAAASKVVVTARCAGGIDSRGLHVTNLNALADCLARVAVPGAKCLSDGFRLGSRCPVEHEAVVDGDARSAAIAAASVIAKVTRDRYMRRAEEVHPGWDFAGNVGYSTPGHREAIAEIGSATSIAARSPRPPTSSWSWAPEARPLRRRPRCVRRSPVSRRDRG